ncbi:MAG TPA: glycosyltransferase family 39 protein [Anaerolineaceae bacterium]|nr:glycosyltransferase family 39 protein [Anaerolineaceae bacterium]
MNQIKQEPSMKEVEGTLFNKSKTLYLGAIIFIFLLGLAIRFYDLTDAPLDFHPTRQLYSALKARGMYYEKLEIVDEEKREFAVKHWKIQGLIEPPVMERLTATIYQVVGNEILWIPRILSILFWTIGGVFLLDMVRRMVDKNAAVFALLLFMITPYTAIASRAFQPDPLMVMFMIIGLWGLIRWNENENIENAILAGLFAGLAIFIKSVVIFPIGFSFLAVVIWKTRSIKKIFSTLSIWVMAGLTLIPYILYMIYGLVINGSLESQFSLRFFPQLWIDPVFWLRWNEMISKVVGLEFFLASIIGILILKKSIHRVFLTSLLLGYFVYGLTLSHHISTHDYYQLPLVPIVIIGASMVFSQIIAAIKNPGWITNGIVIGVIIFFATINAWDVRVTLKRVNYDGEVSFWQKMESVFDRKDSIIGITQDYGYRLNYWGWTGIENWMSSSDFSLRELAGQEFDMKTLFEEEVQGKDYFLVTQLSELDRQPEIRTILYENYQIKEETSDYIIFDLYNQIGN